MKGQKKETVLLSEATQKLSEFLPSILDDSDLEYTKILDELVVKTPSRLIQTVSKTLKTNNDLFFDYLRCLSVVDFHDFLEVNYHLFSYTKRHKIVIKCHLNPAQPSISSVSNIWKAANWFEREAHDLFGVVFDDHPSLDRLLLPDNFEGNPGLKSYRLHEYKEW
jgi:NADH:ubiquinone oxidoreductase subunit C